MIKLFYTILSNSNFCRSSLSPKGIHCKSLEYDMEDFNDTRWKKEINNKTENVDNEDALLFERERIKALAG